MVTRISSNFLFKIKPLSFCRISSLPLRKSSDSTVPSDTELITRVKTNNGLFKQIQDKYGSLDENGLVVTSPVTCGNIITLQQDSIDTINDKIGKIDVEFSDWRALTGKERAASLVQFGKLISQHKCQT